MRSALNATVLSRATTRAASSAASSAAPAIVATAPPSLSPRRRRGASIFASPSKPGKFVDAFSIGKILGEGAWGSVHVARRLSDGAEFAVKTVRHNGNAIFKRVVENEVAAMNILCGATQTATQTPQAEARCASPPPVSPSSRRSGSPTARRLAAAFSTVATASASRAETTIVGVPHLEAVYDDDATTHVVQELCHHGDVLDLVLEHGDSMLSGAAGERRSASIVRQMLTALKACHDQGIVHLDLKPENLLLRAPEAALDNDARARSWFGAAVDRARGVEQVCSSSGLERACESGVVLADFGMARDAPGDAFAEATLEPSLWQLGTVGYSAPEITGADGGARRYSPASDIWSAGITAFVIATRRGAWNFTDPTNAVFIDEAMGGESTRAAHVEGRATPSQTLALTQLLSRNAMFDRSSNQWKSLSAEGQDFVETLVQVDPALRPTVDVALEHPWLSKA